MHAQEHSDQGRWCCSFSLAFCLRTPYFSQELWLDYFARGMQYWLAPYSGASQCHRPDPRGRAPRSGQAARRRTVVKGRAPPDDSSPRTYYVITLGGGAQGARAPPSGSSSLIIHCLVFTYWLGQKRLGREDRWLVI